MTTGDKSLASELISPMPEIPPYIVKRRVTRENKFRELSMSVLFVFAKRFIAGESLEEALPIVKKIKEMGFKTTVDVLGESVSLIHQAKDAADEYCKLIKSLRDNDLELNVSLKPTQLGLDISDQLCFENVCKVLDKAGEMGGHVRIDMEGSAHTDKTLELVRKWRNGYPGVGTVIQSMLKRSPKDVEDLLARGIGIRLCKGAYKEPASIAFKDKTDVDRAYFEIATRLLNSGIYHGIATHDDKLIDKIKEYAVHRGILKTSFEFQMLYGIRSALQKELVGDGWNLRVYVPYGKHWLKYTYRRLRERKENIYFVAKNLFKR